MRYGPSETAMPLRVEMLLTDAFGGFGGIAKFNRDFLLALNASAHIERIHVLPRKISEPVGPDIPDAIVYDRAAAAGRFAYARRFVRRLAQREGIDLVICGHRNLLPAAWLMARVRGARLVLIVHGLEAWRPSADPALNWLSRRIDALISVSRFSAERFSAWSGLPAAKAFILPNCVDLDRFKPRPKDAALAKKYGLDGNPLLLTVGRLAADERYKGFDQVIEAMPRLLTRYPTIKYMIAGDGLDRARLEAKARALSLSDRVIFAGRIAEPEKAAHYNLADVYVMPSAAEGFGIVLIEAAACGIPVVGSGVDGSRETLMDGELGRLVDPGDGDQLYDAIVAALDQGRRDERPAGLERFSKDKFERRVADWAEKMSYAAASGRVHAGRGEAAQGR